MASIKKSFSRTLNIASDNDFATSSSGKNRYIKPEDLCLNCGYSFSFNPETQPDLKDVDGLRSWYNDMKMLFTDRLQYCRVRLFLEFSQFGRWHFHGYIWVKSYEFYLYDVPRINFWGSSEMDIINDPEVWLQYCWKSQTFVQQILLKEFQPMVGPADEPFYDIST